METTFDKLRDKLHEETFDIGEWRNEMHLLINEIDHELTFYKSSLQEVETLILSETESATFAAGWLDWSHLYSFVEWYRHLGGNIHKADEVCFEDQNFGLGSLFGLAFYNITNAIKRRVLDKAKEILDDDIEHDYLETWVNESEIDDNYGGASFNFEPLDESRCINEDLEATAERLIASFMLTDKYIDRKLEEAKE